MNKYRFDIENHLHLFNEKPLTGTSSVVSVLSKPLTWWAAGKALELLGWTPTKTEKEDRIAQASEKLAEIHEIEEPSEYLKLLDKCYRNHDATKNKAATKGTDLHYWLEQFIKSEMGLENKFDELPQDVAERIEPFVVWAKKNVKRWLWSEIHCYSEKLWTGGISDFGAELKDGAVVLGNFKSSKAAYTSHFIQGAGYILEIEENGLFNKNGVSQGHISGFDKLIIVPFGAEKVEPVYNPLPISEYKKAFEAAVVLYRLLGMEEKEK